MTFYGATYIGIVVLQVLLASFGIPAFWRIIRNKTIEHDWLIFASGCLSSVTALSTTSKIMINVIDINDVGTSVGLWGNLGRIVAISFLIYVVWLCRQGKLQ